MIQLYDDPLDRLDHHADRYGRCYNADRKDRDQDTRTFHEIGGVDRIDIRFLQPHKGHAYDLVRIVLIQRAVHGIVCLAADLHMVGVVVLPLLDHQVVDHRVSLRPHETVPLRVHKACGNPHIVIKNSDLQIDLMAEIVKKLCIVTDVALSLVKLSIRIHICALCDICHRRLESILRRHQFMLYHRLDNGSA